MRLTENMQRRQRKLAPEIAIWLPSGKRGPPAPRRKYRQPLIRIANIWIRLHDLAKSRYYHSHFGRQRREQKNLAIETRCQQQQALLLHLSIPCPANMWLLRYSWQRKGQLEYRGWAPWGPHQRGSGNTELHVWRSSSQDKVLNLQRENLYWQETNEQGHQKKNCAPCFM